MTWDELQDLLDRVPAGHDLPMASGFRVEQAREQVGTGLSPEEYAARHAQDWVSWSFGEYAYPDPIVHRWIQRLEGIFFTEGAVEACRDRFLTDAERRVLEARALEPF